jgi:hypothetical protein
MKNYDGIDLLMTPDGDLDLGSNGDINNTEKDQIASLQQKIISLLKSETGDWIDHPTLAVNLNSFIGEPNTRENAKRMETQIKNALIGTKIVEKQDLKVRVNAVGRTRVAIEIVVSARPTAFNSISRELELTFFFSSSDGRVNWSPRSFGGI